MAFPSSTGTKASLAAAWTSATDWASRVKSSCTSVRNSSSAGPIGASQIWFIDTLLFDARAAFQSISDIPGIAAYAQEQVNDPTLNVATEFASMVAQIDATRTWINTNFPKDGSGFLLDRTRDSSARFVDRQFSTATLATFRTVLDELIATID